MATEIVSVMTRYVDHAPLGTEVGRCVVLPGRRYTPDGPLLFFAAQTALQHGWQVREVWWDVPTFGDGAEEVAWVGQELTSALAGFRGRVLVVAKSLGTLAVSAAAEHGYPAAWLTPLLTQADLAQTHLSYPAPQYVLCGASDPYFRQDVYDALPGERCLVPGDHVLRISGDVRGMVASLETFVHSFDNWLAGSPTPSG